MTHPDHEVAVLTELIERLEQATEPSRELANQVLIACGWIIEECGQGPDRTMLWVAPDSELNTFYNCDQPDPTASIDAALTLVEGEWFCVSGPHRKEMTFDAIVGVGKDTNSIGATPAIALVLACLRARLAQATSVREKE